MKSNMLILRPFLPTDQDRVLEILTSSTVNKTYMLPDYEKPEDAVPLFNRLSQLSRDSSRFVRCIALDVTPVGFLNDVEIKDGGIELGYVIHPDSHNRGLMTQGLRAAISELMKLGYEQIICGAFDHNHASIRVMEKCGMKKIPKTDEIEYRGRIHRCVYYSTKEG